MIFVLLAVLLVLGAGAASADEPQQVKSDGHCWSGDREHLNAYSRLTYHERLIPKLVEGWLRNAPRGADVTGWTR